MVLQCRSKKIEKETGKSSLVEPSLNFCACLTFLFHKTGDVEEEVYWDQLRVIDRLHQYMNKADGVNSQHVEADRRVFTKADVMDMVMEVFPGKDDFHLERLSLVLTPLPTYISTRRIPLHVSGYIPVPGSSSSSFFFISSLLFYLATLFISISLVC